ncbi:hypothetical protein KSS87_020384 [Heliosperma pusillum]|nr:hypothetical protein KSS87_020384 [Heliosperma pusillum]
MALDFESLTEATSGAIGALVSTTILYPLDTCKTKYQAEARSHDQHPRYSELLSDLVYICVLLCEAVVNDRQGGRERMLQVIVVPSHAHFEELWANGDATLGFEYNDHCRKLGSLYKSNYCNSANVTWTRVWMSIIHTCTRVESPWLNILDSRNLSDVLWEAVRKGQILSLYQGLGTKNLQSVIQQFIYFYGYSFFKRLYLKKSNSKSMGTTANLIVAAAAGACTVLVTQPLDTASSKMQTSDFGKSKGLWTTLSEGNWRNAFDGLGISLLLTANPSIQYTVFDQLKNKLLISKLAKNPDSESSPQALAASTAFLLGALSKSIATCLTYPAIRCKVVIQAAEREEENQIKTEKTRKTVSGVFYNIWKHEGILGYFKGLEAQILKTVLSSALLLMIKEKITKSTWVLMLALRKYLSLTKTRLKNA